MSAAVRRNDVRLFAHQVRFEQLAFWRNPQSAFFTFALPVLIIVIFGAVFDNGQDSFYYGLTGLQYYIPTIAALSVLGACYTQLALSLTFRRQTGILKRIRATPLPAGIYFLGLVANCVILSAIEVAIIVGVGALYGVPFPDHWTAVIVVLALGAASFGALGVGVASLIRDADAAPAVVQFVLFPLVFVSGTTSRSTRRCSTGSRTCSRCGRSTRRCSAYSPSTGAWPPTTSLCCSPGECSARSSATAASGGIRGPNS